MAFGCLPKSMIAWVVLNEAFWGLAIAFLFDPYIKDNFAPGYDFTNVQDLNYLIRCIETASIGGYHTMTGVLWLLAWGDLKMLKKVSIATLWICIWYSTAVYFLLPSLFMVNFLSTFVVAIPSIIILCLPNDTTGTHKD